MKYALFALILLAACKKSNNTPAVVHANSMRVHIWASDIVNGQQLTPGFSDPTAINKNNGAFRKIYASEHLHNFDSTFSVAPGQMYEVLAFASCYSNNGFNGQMPTDSLQVDVILSTGETYHGASDSNPQPLAIKVTIP